MKVLVVTFLGKGRRGTTEVLKIEDPENSLHLHCY